MVSSNDYQGTWARIIGRVRDEFLRAPAEEKDWITQKLIRIGVVQRELHALFLQAQGPSTCAGCLGACCDRGRNHFTLVNLLGFLHAGQPLPHPDFKAPCPFLGSAGCMIEAALRPFNCITFNCERVEDNLSPMDRQRFYALEKELRGLYGAFDARYAGSSLRGLFIRHERLGESAFLARTSASVDSKRT